MSFTELLKLPAHFHLQTKLREQLSGRPGHQRCVEGDGELLLVIHEVPKPAAPERQAIYFWKQQDGTWQQAAGPGLSDLGLLLDRYEKAIDHREEQIDQADTAAEIFSILRHSGPLARTTRNLVQALMQVLSINPDDREMRHYHDRAREIERAADLLNTDARVTLEFWRAERAEEQSLSSARLNHIAFRLNLLAGFFLPLVAFSGIFGMNVDLPPVSKTMFWVILLAGACVGGCLLWLVGRKTGESHEVFKLPDEERTPRPAAK